MNEDYLKQFRRSPDSKFVEKIHARLEKKQRLQVIRNYSVFSALAVMFLIGILMTFSSTVRAEVLQTIEEIAGLRFDVTSNYPGDPDEEVTIVPSEYLSLIEAQNHFPSPVMLPTYVPQGYERQTDVEFFVLGDTPTLVIRWDSNEKSAGNIELDIKHCPSGFENCGMTVGEGALEEIMLNGKPAAVIRGAWNYDTQQYDLSPMTAIQWKYDENTVYTLSTWNQDMPLEELIRMSESIP